MSTVNVDSLLIERPTRYGNADNYSVGEVIIPNATVPVGSGADATVTVSFVFSESNLPSNLDYCISVAPSMVCTWIYANKATTGFDIVFKPPATATLAAGTADVRVIWSVED